MKNMDRWKNVQTDEVIPIYPQTTVFRGYNKQTQTNCVEGECEFHKLMILKKHTFITRIH